MHPEENSDFEELKEQDPTQLFKIFKNNWVAKRFRYKRFMNLKRLKKWKDLVKIYEHELEKSSRSQNRCS